MKIPQTAAAAKVVEQETERIEVAMLFPPTGVERAHVRETEMDWAGRLIYIYSCLTPTH